MYKIKIYDLEYYYDELDVEEIIDIKEVYKILDYDYYRRYNLSIGKVKMENILFRDDNNLPKKYFSQENGSEDLISYEGKRIYFSRREFYSWCEEKRIRY